MRPCRGYKALEAEKASRKQKGRDPGSKNKNRKSRSGRFWRTGSSAWNRAPEKDIMILLGETFNQAKTSGGRGFKSRPVHS